jgi:hypothetical protein
VAATVVDSDGSDHLALAVDLTVRA